MSNETLRKLTPVEIKDLALYNIGVAMMILEKDNEVPQRIHHGASAAATMAKVAISITKEGKQLDNKELIEYLHFLAECQRERQEAAAKALKEKEETDANHQAVAKPDQQDSNEAAQATPDA